MYFLFIYLIDVCVQNKPCSVRDGVEVTHGQLDTWQGADLSINAWYTSLHFYEFDACESGKVIHRCNILLNHFVQRLDSTLSH